MKKYIILLGFLSYVIMPAISGPSIYQDSTRHNKDNNKSEFIFMTSEDLEKFNSMSEEFEELKESFSNFDFQNDFNELDFGEELASLKENFKDFGETFNYNTKDKEDKAPTRIEKKSFSNISEIEVDHKYGNIILRESNSKKIELEIQYFDSKDNKATCDISVSKNLLSVITTTSNKNNVKINYIISIPRNTGLFINLKYGNMKIDEHRGAFAANISYGNLDAQTFSGTTPDINIKYGNMNINSAKDIKLIASYSKVNLGKVDNLKVSGKYTNYEINEIKTIDTGEEYSYGDFKIKTITSMNAKVKYADITIDNLISDLGVNVAYSDINIKNVSANLTSININGSYSDVMIILPENLSVGISTDLFFGNLIVSKKHNVIYTQQIQENNLVKKTGIIGNSKNPKATIKVSNKYADVRIR